ncbi:endo-1,4-beta-xylanase [Egicoccus halophilus]|uniref:Beta-xylanase n=1 Tax=Egicoccus halophilus TaxID=1670830 RepID=A0A8J3ADM4_9ACTN|nr:endo-1,4-beta-xylanase [Egicoccus halophilus]GGI09775.1 hypothetical protein GCM10011354_35750 [Egicoccus halophilus]
MRRTRTPRRSTVALSLAAALAATALAPTAGLADDTARPASATDTLRGVAPLDLEVGVAVAGGGHHLEMPYPDPFPNDVVYRSHLAREFSSLTPENHLKWEFVHPEQGTYNLAPAEAIVEFAEANGQVVRGHTLLWHSQNPLWLEEGDFTPDELRGILREHILTVVGHFAGRIQQWDVANEIFTGEGEFREENIWIRNLGPGIIADAFRWAHEADPDALLFFNDYSVESINAKSTAYYELAQQLLDEGVPVDGFGAQGHLGIQWGFPGDLQANLERFDALGLETAITEVDVRMVLDDTGRPTPAQLARQADDYRRTLQACLNVEGCRSYTIWGWSDRYSWVPVFFPDQGAATVTFEDFSRKPAYYALHRTLLDSLPGYPDVPAGAHEANIRALSRDGIVAGFRDGTFRPASSLTRGQLATLLAQAAGLDTTGTTTRFTDVAGTQHEGAIAALVAAGVVDGYRDHTFRPGATINRAQLATMLANWLELDDVDTGPFTDLTPTHAGAINALYGANVVFGTTATTFSPNQPVRRDQAASLVSRARVLTD